jgi:hypothetical protein
MNVHPAEDLAGVRAGLAAIARPLAERLQPGRESNAGGAWFGVGMYAPAAAVRELDAEPAAFAALADDLRRLRLAPITWNAFPFERFHTPGLKERVFAPGWHEAARVEHTLAVARTAARLAAALTDGRPAHISISTHTGRFGPWNAPAERAAAVAGFARAAGGAQELERTHGVPIVLALEAEPRANANDTRELAAWIVELRALAGPDAARALGWCLDACHLAVEFEEPALALDRVARSGARLAKLQVTSALALRDPGARPAARDELFALAEPVYLHQLTALRADGELLQARDLPEVAELVRAGDPHWLAAREWRCHFHVPVGLASRGGLGTTSAAADELVAAALADPSSWGGSELQLELETYTWSLLGGGPPSAAALVDGLEREYRHVLELLARHGWQSVAR